MRKRPFLSNVVSSALLATSLAVAPMASAPAEASTSNVSALTLLNHLHVHSHTHGSTYGRSKFKLWIDANDDCETTRAEVLIKESKARTTENKYCTVKTGRWVSKYDGKVFTSAIRLQIDHLVPLENAWVSGAASWSSIRREAYANDLGYAYSLIAVSAHANESKGDRDPSAYLPPATSYRCTYVKTWIAVKSRWGLTVTSSEKSTLKSDLRKYCKSNSILKPGKPNIGSLT